MHADPPHLKAYDESLNPPREDDTIADTRKTKFLAESYIKASRRSHICFVRLQADPHYALGKVNRLKRSVFSGILILVQQENNRRWQRPLKRYKKPSGR